MNFSLANGPVFAAAVRRLIPGREAQDGLLSRHGRLERPDPARLERMLVKALCEASPGLVEAEARSRVREGVNGLLKPSQATQRPHTAAPTARDLARAGRKAQVRRMRQFR